MKIKLKAVFFGLGVVVVGVILLFYILDNRSVKGELNHALGRLEIEQERTREVEMEAQRIEANMATRINRLNEYIGKLEQREQKILVAMEAKEKDLIVLEDEFTQLEDKDKMIQNLQRQIEIWKEKFSLAVETIKNKDQIIFSLKRKYESQVIITNAYKIRWEQAHKLNSEYHESLRLSKKRIKNLERGGKIKNIILAGALGFMLWKIVE